MWERGLDLRDTEEEASPRCSHQLEAGGEERTTSVMFGFWLSIPGSLGARSCKEIKEEKI